MPDRLKIVTKSDPNGLPRPIILLLIFGPDGDDRDYRKDSGNRCHNHPKLLIEHNILGEAPVLLGQTSYEHLSPREENQVINRIKNREQRSLLWIIGQAGLRGFGDNTLAGIAQIVDAVDCDKPAYPQGPCGNHRSHKDHQKGAEGQDDIANHHKRTIFPQPAVGLIQQVAHKRIRDPVPDTHNHGKRSGQNNSQANPSVNVIGNK